MIDNLTPHPNLINNWQIKTRAKVGKMLMDLVAKNKEKEIKISGITNLSKKYNIGDKTFVKYLKKNIFIEPDRKGHIKILFLSENDIVIIKEIMYLEKKYSGNSEAQKKLLRCLIAHLGRM